MSSEPDGMQAFSKALTTVMEAVAEAAVATAKAVIPALHAVSKAMWEAYRQAGMPYGETHEGLMRWMHDLGEIKRHEVEIERIRQHHDTLISARLIGEAIRARREEKQE